MFNYVSADGRAKATYSRVEKGSKAVFFGSFIRALHFDFAQRFAAGQTRQKSSFT